MRNAVIVRFGHLEAQNGRHKHLSNTDKSIYVSVCLVVHLWVICGSCFDVPLVVVFSQGICKRVRELPQWWPL